MAVRPRQGAVMDSTQTLEHTTRPFADIETMLRRKGAAMTMGGAFDRWDMEIRGGLFGIALWQ